MEPRRFPRRRTGTLWCVSYAKDVLGRRQEQPLPPGLGPAGLVCSEHHERCKAGTRWLVGGRVGCLHEDRTQPRLGCDWPYGRRGLAVELIYDGPGSEGNRDLSEDHSRREE